MSKVNTAVHRSPFAASVPARPTLLQIIEAKRHSIRRWADLS